MSLGVCAACVYFSGDQSLEESEAEKEESLSLGRCKRHPPILTLTDTAYREWEVERSVRSGQKQWMPRASHSFIFWSQPIVISHDSCGEFQRR